MKLRARFVILQIMLALACGLCLFAAPSSALASDIAAVKVEAVDNATIITVTFDGAAPAPDKAFKLTEGATRFVLDWQSAKPRMSYPKNSINGAGALKAVRYSARGQGTRLVLDLEPSTPITERKVIGRDYIIIVGGRIAPAARPATSAVAPVSYAQPKARIAPRYFPDSIPYPILKPKPEPQNTDAQAPAQFKPVRRPVIVIDPGHGGYDPGALGQKGTKEKNITFAASVELQKQLLATGRYEVMLTRSKDVYVEHEERLRIARAGGADLFISIHADSAGPKARGATVYTLADRSKTRSRRLVNTQNWIMDVDLTEQSDPVGDILVDLAQRSTANNSSQFADVLLEELAGATRLINNSHRRAGYFVLLAPDVPAVLLELGYLSHAADEALLNKVSHRKKVMRSVTTAINRYFDTQKP